ncbi:sirohydrochlorin chelatase [Anaerobacillus sp. MEB173]|uniref:sirohydrochlorin chelatase n=1 Tax=Anaerobacillus sp. MEB173 TaxID=3383345 RepID=UPI003F925B4B
MNAVLFVGHGSKDPEGNEEIIRFVDMMREKIDAPVIETCFLEFARPTIEEGIKRCVERGASHVALIPMMFFSAGHAKIHIPHEIDHAKEHYPHVKFTYGRPIGVHQQLMTIFIERLSAVNVDRFEADERTALLVVGRGSSDPDANSDLFKISRLLSEQFEKEVLVETAFMGVTTPTVEQGIERCLRLGSEKVIIVPYFLFTGVLIKRLERNLVTYQQRYENIEFQMTQYFGFHPGLTDIFLDRVTEALGDEAKLNCDMCQYRLHALEHMDIHHHHHHDDDHEHGHHHHEVKVQK